MTLSRQALREEQKRIEQEAEERRRQVAAQLQQSFEADVDALCERIGELAKEAGMHAQTFVEQHVLPCLSAKPKRLTNAEPKSAKLAKYRDPETGATWGGQGQKPKWFAERLKAGWSKEDLLIANQGAANGHAHA